MKLQEVLSFMEFEKDESNETENNVSHIYCHSLEAIITVPIASADNVTPVTTPFG